MLIDPIPEFASSPYHFELMTILQDSDYKSYLTETSKKKEEPRASVLLAHMSAEKSFDGGLKSLQAERQTKSSATNAGYALKSIFSAVIEEREVTPAGAADVVTLLRPLVHENSTFSLPEELKVLMTTELREFLSALLSNASDMIKVGEPKEPPFIAANTESIGEACVYAYTYGFFVDLERMSRNTRIPIKVGCTDVAGLDRIKSQINASTFERPLVLMACNLPEHEPNERVARSYETIFHKALAARGCKRTHGPKREWFSASIEEIFSVAEEIGLEPIEVTPVNY